MLRLASQGSQTGRLLIPEESMRRRSVAVAQTVVRARVGIGRTTYLAHLEDSRVPAWKSLHETRRASLTCADGLAD
jgi:hypothetical protein